MRKFIVMSACAVAMLSLTATANAASYKEIAVSGGGAIVGTVAAGLNIELDMRALFWNTCTEYFDSLHNHRSDVYLHFMIDQNIVPKPNEKESTVDHLCEPIALLDDCTEEFPALLFRLHMP